MSNFRRFVGNLRFDGWVLGLTGLVAIMIGILDLTPFVNLTADPMLKMIVIALGLLMGAIVAQTGRRALEITELREALGLVEVEGLEAKRSFPQHLVQSVLRAQKFILDTNLNEEVPRGSGDPQRQYRQILDERLRKGDLSFRRVEVIFNKERLEKVVRRLLKHEGQDYFIRHYDPPPRAIPVLHMMSFDDERFYLGGFYPAESPTEERAIYIRQSEIAQLFRDYWNVLWLRAIPLNEGKRINWAELKRIALRVGMTEPDFNAMIARLKDEAQRDRQQVQRQ
jgi:hypothetical protein